MLRHQQTETNYSRHKDAFTIQKAVIIRKRTYTDSDTDIYETENPLHRPQLTESERRLSKQVLSSYSINT